MVFYKENQNLIIKEEIIPKIIEKLDNKAQNFPAIYKDKEDFKELLNFSNKNFETTNLKSWAEVLPLYPLSPFN